MNSDRRFLLVFGSFVLIVCLCFIIPRECSVRREAIEKARQEEAYLQELYSEALERLKNGDYAEGDYYLYRAGYAENTVLRLFAKAGKLYRKHDSHSIEAYAVLDKIPASYQGDLAEEIKSFREEAQLHRDEIQALYDRQIEFLAEMERLKQQNKNTGSSNTKKKKKNSSAKSDLYDVYDYTHADDFYYDHWDDFSDFEEAEDYFDEHQ